MTGPPPQGFGSQPGSYDYAELRRIWEGALAGRRGKTKSGKVYTRQEINEYIRRQVGEGSAIANMTDLTRAMMHAQGQAEQEVGVEKPSPGARIAAGIAEAGAGMGLNLPKRLAPDYFARVEAQNPTQAKIANFAGTIPPFMLGSAVAGPKLLAQGAAGGLLGGTLSGAELRPGASAGNAAKQIGVGTGLGFLGGMGGALAGRAFASRVAPAANVAEQQLQRAGGVQGLERAAQRLGTPEVPLTLAESSPGFTRMAAREIGTLNPEAQAGLAQDTRAVLGAVGDAKRAIASRYRVLEQTLDTPEIQAIVRRPEVQEVLADLQRAGVGPPNELTARTLNDVRMILADESRRLLRSRATTGGSASAKRIAVQLTEASSALDEQLRAAIPEFGEIQAQIAPYIQREIRLQAILRRVEGPQGAMGVAPGRGGRIPVGKSGMRAELSQALGQQPHQLSYKAGAALAPILMKPAAADVLATSVHDLVPAFLRPGRVPGLLAAPAVTPRRKVTRLLGY